MIATERATRCLMVALFIAAPLFMLVELSPTAWAIGLALALLINNPRRGVDAALLLTSPFAISLLGFAVIGALSALWSGDPARSLRASAVFAGFVVMGALVLADVMSLSAEQRHRVWNALALGAAIGLLLLAAIEIRFKPSDLTAARSLHKTTFYGLLFAAVLLFPEQKWLRLRLLFVILIYAIPTLLLGRTTGVNLAILASAPLLFLAQRGLRRVLFAFCGVYCALALAAPFIVEQVFHQVDQSRIASLPQVSSYMARLELWYVMAPEIKSALWLGHGADTTRVAILTPGHWKYYDLPDIPSAHNMVFDLWYELGLVGIAVLLWNIVAAARIIERFGRASLLIGLIVLLGTVIELSVDHRIWLSWVQGALVLAVSACVLAAREDHDRSFIARTIARSSPGASEKPLSAVSTPSSLR